MNISTVNFENEKFVDWLIEVLAANSLDARLIDVRRRLRLLGITCSIDEFATGYNSFSYLQDIPAAAAKIDQSFIRSLTSSERNRKLAGTMITMAHALGYDVAAEGVET